MIANAGHNENNNTRMVWGVSPLDNIVTMTKKIMVTKKIPMTKKMMVTKKITRIKK